MRTATLLILMLVAVIFAVQNAAKVAVDVLFRRLASLAIVIALCVATGVLVGVLITVPRIYRMPLRDLICFTHEVDGRSFAGWFRTVGQDESRSSASACFKLSRIQPTSHLPTLLGETLARFIRGRQRKGLPIPSVEQIKALID